MDRAWWHVRFGGDNVADVFLLSLSLASGSVLDDGIWRGVPSARWVVGGVQKIQWNDVVHCRCRVGGARGGGAGGSRVCQGLVGRRTGSAGICRVGGEGNTVGARGGVSGGDKSGSVPCASVGDARVVGRGLACGSAAVFGVGRAGRLGAGVGAFACGGSGDGAGAVAAAGGVRGRDKRDRSRSGGSGEWFGIRVEDKVRKNHKLC